MKLVTKSKKITLSTSKKGSLGILALGAIGVLEWRKVRDENEPKQKN